MPWLSDFDLRQIDDDYFMLLADLVYYSVKHGVKVTAPASMISDGPSVPRAPFLYLLFGHRGKRAAVIHDWLYRNMLFPREICDGIYKEALLDSGKYDLTSNGMYTGVRVGGASSYNSKKLGCLDPRKKKCSRGCGGCKDYFEGYKLTAVPYRINGL